MKRIMKKKKERSRDREEEREREGACERERWRLEDEGASSLNFLKKPDPCFFYKRSLCCYFLHLLQTRAIFLEPFCKCSCWSIDSYPVLGTLV